MHFPWIIVLLVVAVAWQNARRWKCGWSHGRAASFITSGELDRCGMVGDDGLILGRWSTVFGLLSPRVRSEIACGLFMAAFFKSRWMSERLIRLRKVVHLSAFAPAAAGKSVRVPILNLLSYCGPCVVIDPKGELLKATAEHRRRKFGRKIYRLDPFGICGPGADSFNPIASVDAAASNFLNRPHASLITSFDWVRWSSYRGQHRSLCQTTRRWPS